MCHTQPKAEARGAQREHCVCLCDTQRGAKQHPAAAAAATLAAAAPRSLLGGRAFSLAPLPPGSVSAWCLHVCVYVPHAARGQAATRAGRGREHRWSVSLWHTARGQAATRAARGREHRWSVSMWHTAKGQAATRAGMPGPIRWRWGPKQRDDGAPKKGQKMR